MQDQNASDEEVISGSKIMLLLMNLLKNLPNKFDTIIGEDGVRLVWWRKTKTFNSKSYFKETPIILLDEATSSLDC